MHDLERFERNTKRHLQRFIEGKPKPPKAEATCSTLKGYTVILRVRKKQLAPDESFTHHSTSGSQLLAEIEARKAAKAAGWPIITYVIDMVAQER